MSKKNNIFIIFLFGLFVYLFLPTISVKATDYAFMQCNYETEWLSETAERYKPSDKKYDISLYYSDYKATSIIQSDTPVDITLGLFNDVDDKIAPIPFLSSAVAASVDADKAFGLIGSLLYGEGFFEDVDDPVNFKATTAFQKALKEKDGCPTYLYAKSSSSKGEKTADIYFSNQLETYVNEEGKTINLCSDAANKNESCLILLKITEIRSSFFDSIADRISTHKGPFIMESKSRWTFDLECPEVADDDKTICAKIDIYPDVASKTLRYNATNRTLSQDVIADDVTNGIVYDVTMESLYHLYNSIPMEIGYNPKEHNSKSSWLSGVCFERDGELRCGEDYCPKIVNTKIEYDCKTYDDVSAEISQAFDEASKASRNIEEIAKKYLIQNREPQTYEIYAQEFYSSKDKSELIDLVNNLNGEHSIAQEELNKLNTFTQTLEGIMDVICESFKDKINSYITSLYNSSTRANDLITKLTEALNRIKSAAIEKGATEDEINGINDTIDKFEKLKLEANKLFKFAEDAYLTTKGLNLNRLSLDGCGILSPDMIEFLKTILWYIRIAGVVLAIILSLVDFVKASMSSDEKSIATVNKKFVTRIILVAILFLVPVLLEFLLNTLNIESTAKSLECIK